MKFLQSDNVSMQLLSSVINLLDHDAREDEGFLFGALGKGRNIAVYFHRGYPICRKTSRRSSLRYGR